MIHAALPNAACPGLHQKPLPLDTAIGRLIAPYCPGDCQGGSKQNNNEKGVHIAGRFDGRGGVPVQYRAHHPKVEVHGFPKSHKPPPLGALALIASIKHACP